MGKHDPYLVVGTGRSGTSTVAGILHNKMDVFMGYEFPTPNGTNPSGFWEDIEFYNMNRLFVSGEINYSTWEKEVKKIISRREGLERPWGFKESRMGELLGLYLGFFKNPRIIRCKRDKELVISSLSRCYDYSLQRATTFWRERENTIDNTLSGKDFLEIHFGRKKISDEEIMKLIGGKWNCM